MADSAYKITEIYPSRKPFMDDNGKRKVPDLRTQVLTGEAKRHCHGIQGNAHGQVFTGMQGVNQQLQQQQQQQLPGEQDSRQATDFIGFFQELKQHQPNVRQHHRQEDRRQQDQGTDENSSRLPQQQQQHFLDKLMSQHSLQSAPPAQQQLQSMISLDVTFPPDASRDGFVRGPAGAAGSDAAVGPGSHAAAAGQERWHLPNLQLLPWDWSVKSKVRFSSTAAFALLDEQRTAGLGPVCQATSAGGMCKDTQDLSNQERLARALMQYQHPSAAMSRSMLAALRAGPDKEGPASLAARVHRWREALRSAYTALRHGHCPVLYVVGQAFRQQFTAVLCAPGVLGCQQLHAVVGRSNKQLRQHLAAFGCTGQVAGLVEAQQQQQQAAMGHQQAPRQQLTASAFDGQPGSQLLVFGALQVHGLYAALQALPWCAQEQPDVPLLAAPVQCMHFTLSPLRLEVLPDALHDQQQQQQHKQQEGTAGACHARVAELSTTGGLGVMPWTLHQLLSVMQDSQGPAGLDTFLEAEPSSSTLNVLPEAWQHARRAAVVAVAAGMGGSAAGAAEDEGAGCQRQHQRQDQQPWQAHEQGLSSVEQQSWAASRSLLQGRVLKHLRVCPDGELLAKLG